MKKYFFILLVTIIFSTVNVWAKPKSTLIYVNNTNMQSSTRIFISENINVNISIRPTSNSIIDDDSPQYGYVAVCSALGSFSDRYVSTVSSSVLTDMSVVNSTVGCTIPGTSAYANLSFVKYYTFKIPWSNWNCSTQGSTCYWNNNLDFAYYQPNTDEISIISYGFQNEPFNFNDTVNPSYWQNQTIIDQNSTIINNQNSNTNTIINNQNSNTQSIIDNQNSNTQSQIDSQKSCTLYDKSTATISGYLNSNGEVSSTSSSLTVSDFIRISSSDSITVLGNGSNGQYACFYNSGKNKLSCINGSNITSNTTLSIPGGAYYFRYSSNSGGSPRFNICKDGNQALTDTLNDDNVNGAEKDASDFFSNFSTDTHGLTGIITAPLSAIESLTSATCSPLTLPLPFIDEDLELPCMRSIYEEFFGDFMDIYDIVVLGVLSYWIMVRIFAMVKDFKNPEHDEVEVMEL